MIIFDNVIYYHDEAVIRSTISMKSRWWHFLSLLIVTVSGFMAITFSPDLWQDDLAKLGSVGFFVTLYGLLFTIVEVLRLNSLTQATSAVADKVYNVITNLSSIKEITECQAKIESALTSLDEGAFIPSTTMLSIVKTYSAIFYLEMKDDQSVYRKNSGLLESYCFNPNTKQQSLNRNTKKVKEALMSISGHLAGSSAKTYSEAKNQS